MTVLPSRRAAPCLLGVAGFFCGAEAYAHLPQDMPLEAVLIDLTGEAVEAALTGSLPS
ncbi:hypothetical protein [Streptomyces sp. NPDC049590]|uniref:hypothetical protein n=1 Tax=Streptomyces sp. NPDC049590 TaxID=3154834 RepID=UPI0034209CA3